MTRNGLAFAAMVVTSAIVGWLLDWQEFRIIAIGGALLLLLSAAFFWGPLDMKCRRHVEPGLRTTVGEPTFGVVKFDRQAAGSRFGLAFEDKFDGDALVAIPPRLEAGAETRYELPTNRRGVFSLGPFEVVRGDPFGFFRRSKVLGGSLPLRVRPRILDIASLPQAVGRGVDGATSETSPLGGDVFHAVRPYEFGDDHRLVHWRSTARIGELMVRQNRDSERPDLMLLLDDRESSYAHPDDFERAVEIAASIAVAAAREALPLQLFAVHQTMTNTRGTTNTVELVDQLTSIGMEPDGDLVPALHNAMRGNRTVSTAIVISGRTIDDEFAASFVSETGAAQNRLALSVASDAVPEIRRLGGVSALTVPTGEAFVEHWPGLVAGV